jgi:hypothetical protein
MKIRDERETAIQLLIQLLGKDDFQMICRQSAIPRGGSMTDSEKEQFYDLLLTNTERLLVDSQRINSPPHSPSRSSQSRILYARPKSVVSSPSTRSPSGSGSGTPPPRQFKYLQSSPRSPQSGNKLSEQDLLEAFSRHHV